MKSFLKSYFKFEKGHFISGSDAKIDFSTISDKLVVYSMKTLDDIKKELAEATLKEEEKLNKNYIASKAVLKDDTKNTADTVNSDTKALNAAFRSEFIEKLNGYFSNTKTDKTNTISLGKLLDGLKDYHIEIEYTAPVKSTNTLASVSAVVSDTKPASVEPNKVSVSLKLADIPESKIFLPSFIRTDSFYSDTVFIAISNSITETDVDKHFNAILDELENETKVKDTLTKALETFKRTASIDDFNDIFNEYIPTELNLQPQDLTTIQDVVTVDGNNCKFNIAYLSTVGEKKRLEMYRYYSRMPLSATMKTIVVDKPEAVTKFFTLVKERLDEGKTALENAPDFSSDSPRLQYCVTGSVILVVIGIAGGISFYVFLRKKKRKSQQTSTYEKSMDL